MAEAARNGPRVVGIDPGTVSIDLCGLAGDAVFLDRTLATADALAEPDEVVRMLRSCGPLDVIAGPSGYGLPLVPGWELTEEDLRLAVLAEAGEVGGLGGLTSLVRALASSGLPVVFTPGVVHLASVPAHRKVNRVDMGTADKVCAAALAIDAQCRRRDCAVSDVSLILLELGGAFTAAVAVDAGRIVDGLGGSSGPAGQQSPGAWDGEVAYLAGQVTKAMLFAGGLGAIPEADVSWAAFLEGGLKAIALLMVAVPAPAEIVLSGRMARSDRVFDAFADRLGHIAPVRRLGGFATVAKQAAQGAALIADGLAGGPRQPLVEALGLREARGTVLDHLYAVAPGDARRRLGIA